MTEFSRPPQQPRPPDKSPRTPTDATKKYGTGFSEAATQAVMSLGLIAAGGATVISAFQGDFRNTLIYGCVSAAGLGLKILHDRIRP